MRAFVVTLMDLPESVEVANRCILSGKKYDIHIEQYRATDKEKSLSKAKDYGLKLRKYDTSFSEVAPVVGNFISQYELWLHCNSIDEDILILEHDAIFMKAIPDLVFDSILSIGICSFGISKKVSPGIHKTFSKPGGNLPGAHAYIVKPKGAKRLIEVAKNKGILPVDKFLNNKDFPELEELSPGIVKADDSFTTIQKLEGCKAKHNFNYKDYKILT